jgi:hypothetical protein
MSRIPTPKLKAPDVRLPKLSAPDITLPKPGAVAKAVGNAAGEVAERSRQVGQVASEVQKASDAIGGNGKQK